MEDISLHMKLGDILGGGDGDDDFEDSLQGVGMREAPMSKITDGILRSMSPVRRVKSSASEKEDVDVCADELNAMRMIGNNVRKFILAGKVTKFASEFLLRCVGEYE